MNTKAIKSQATQIGLVSAGFMGANLISKIAPIKNEKIKAVIPLILGLGLAMASKNKNLQVIGSGVASFGVLKTVRTLLVGDPLSINGIADNPAVKKVIDMLIPNLGEIEFSEYDTEESSYEDYFEPAIVDVPFEEVSGVGNLEEESLLGAIEEESLLGMDYDNEMYL